MEKLTMTVKEMAAAMGISYPKALELTEREDFSPLIRIGRKKVIVMDGFKRWLEAQTAPALAGAGGQRRQA